MAAAVLVAGVVGFAGFIGAGRSTKPPCRPAKSCQTTTTTTTPSTTAPGGYLFSDEFDGTGPPDPAKWWATPWCATGAANQEGCYNAANVYRDGTGHLVLKISNGTMGRLYDFAQVQTFKETGWPPSTVYAQLSPPVRVEARIMFGAGVGVWGAFWFNSNTSSATNLELDVQEFRGLYPDQDTCHALIITNYGATITTPFDGSADWHLYWMNYYPDHVVFGVDGLTCGQTTLPAAPNEMIRLTNIVGVPGTWGGAGGPPPASAIPALMLVDYVHATGL